MSQPGLQCGVAQDADHEQQERGIKVRDIIKERYPYNSLISEYKLIDLKGGKKAVSIPDYQIVMTLLSWAPQKIYPFILDLFGSYVLVHWLEWLSTQFLFLDQDWRSQCDDPEFIKAFAKTARDLHKLKEVYYQVQNRRWEEKRKGVTK
jgi:hypothetical protein